MQEIKCPNCGQVFKIDESNYDSIVRQIRNHEFDKEVKEKLDAAISLEKKDAELLLSDKMNEKDQIIASLKQEIEASKNNETQKIENAISKQKDIIAQKEIEITESTTAFDIVRKGMKIGIALFSDFIEELLKGEKMEYDVEYSADSKLFRKSILPQGGILDMDDTAHNIQKLLRAYDYHGSNVIPPLKVDYEHELWNVKKYEIREYSNDELPEFELTEKNLIVNKDGGKIHIILCKA